MGKILWPREDLDRLQHEYCVVRRKVADIAKLMGKTYYAVDGAITCYGFREERWRIQAEQEASVIEYLKTHSQRQTALDLNLTQHRVRTISDNQKGIHRHKPGDFGGYRGFCKTH